MPKKSRADRCIERARARIKKQMIKTVIAPDGEMLNVDAFIKPVLIHLWSRGVKTLVSCAGHIPSYKAYIKTERNTDFEKYAVNSPWQTETSPIFDIKLKPDTTFQPLTRHGAYYSRDSLIITDTEKTCFFVHACHAKEGYSRKSRRRFLRWLMDY